MEKNTTEEPRKDKQKEKNITKKSYTKVTKSILLIIVILILIFLACLEYILFRPKFKNLTIELGTEKINIEDFVVSKIYLKNARSVTDLSKIDLSRVGEYDITFVYKSKEEDVTLKIVDTTPPQVEFQNVIKDVDYQINPEDFIKVKSDLSDMTVEISNIPEINEFADYKVNVKVKDKYGNATEGECILSITWLKTEATIELGNKFTIEDIILNPEEHKDKISKDEIEKVDTNKVGEYILTVEENGKIYTSTIKVQDTTAPTLVLKNLSIYDDEKISSYKKFIEKVYDASGDTETILKTDIDYKKIGKQDVIIEAVDINGNRIEKTATLTIKKDTEGPVFTGLTDININKNAEINYIEGVQAKDTRDGLCEFTIDSNGVNISTAGTYYATYTSKDSKGNITTKKRKITVNHDQEDTNAKFEEFYNKYCVGKEPAEIARTIRENIKYSSDWGGNDPVWFGLTEGKGNCYVHTSLVKRALDKAGYTNQIIYLEDKSHYWNLVYMGGVWRHIDGTPGNMNTIGPLTDEQKLADQGVYPKTWDISKWPSAE